ncbi:MAG: DUF1822 family protein [Stigonema ocellatum SAG 48.90 = DSM 106950]|nr:DUF1822 family protein [Stigonema ocellatum SAG 48.90 = DSM 106950]
MKSITNKQTFTVPLSFEAHAIAQEYSQGISNLDKAKQVYLNTLAVYTVDYYLRLMGFKTDWNKSDSRNHLAIKLMDVADLEVQNIGKLECCPVLPEAESCDIPLEVWEDRIGYVAVQFNSDLKEATILGFTRQAAAEVSFNELQSLEDFLVYLSQLEKVEFIQEAESSSLVKVGQWLEGFVDAGWQKIDEILNPEQLGLAFMSVISITRGQKIDLGMQLGKISVALVVKIIVANEAEVDILTQVHPMGEIVLPEGVKLIIGDESGEVVLEVASRAEDNWIQLEFSAELGEKFKITVAYGESELTKEFEV